MTDADRGHPEGFGRLPPSAKYVYRELERGFGGEATRAELIDATGLPERTVDDALDTLENRDYLFTARDSADPRYLRCEIRDSRRV